MVVKAKTSYGLLKKVGELGREIEKGGYVFVPTTISPRDTTKLEALVKWMELFLEMINSQEVQGGTMPLGDVSGGKNLMMESLVNMTGFIMGLLDIDIHKGDDLIPDNLGLFVLSRFLEELLARNLFP